MKNHICISTGCLYRLFNDINARIEELSKFSPSGIELCFSCPEDLLNFEINKENLRHLRILKFNSIHAPFEKVIYGYNKISDEVLSAISKLYKKINARNVVFHNGQIKEYSPIINYGFAPSLENVDWRKPKHRKRDIKDALDKNEQFKFTFDFAHAYTVSSSDIPNYINDFKDKLIEIHISIRDKKLKDHWFLYKYDSQEMRNLLNYLKNVNVPFVLECVASDWTEVPLIKKEIEYIKKTI